MKRILYDFQNEICTKKYFELTRNSITLKMSLVFSIHIDKNLLTTQNLFNNKIKIRGIFVDFPVFFLYIYKRNTGRNENFKTKIYN